MNTQNKGKPVGVMGLDPDDPGFAPASQITVFSPLGPVNPAKVDIHKGVDRLLERLREVHGEPRYDLPAGLIQR